MSEIKVVDRATGTTTEYGGASVTNDGSSVTITDYSGSKHTYSSQNVDVHQYEPDPDSWKAILIIPAAIGSLLLVGFIMFLIGVALVSSVLSFLKEILKGAGPLSESSAGWLNRAWALSSDHSKALWFRIPVGGVLCLSVLLVVVLLHFGRLIQPILPPWSMTEGIWNTIPILWEAIPGMWNF